MNVHPRWKRGDCEQSCGQLEQHLRIQEKEIDMLAEHIREQEQRIDTTAGESSTRQSRVEELEGELEELILMVENKREALQGLKKD